MTRDPELQRIPCKVELEDGQGYKLRLEGEIPEFVCEGFKLMNNLYNGIER